tara:strand:- start:47 stop:250 length:204 start_codon:yes stop_codon:yes gene_type:complete
MRVGCTLEYPHPLPEPNSATQKGLLEKETNSMKYIKLLWKLIDELAEGLTQNGRVEILPEEENNDTI